MIRPEDDSATNAAEALYATPSSIVGVFVADPDARSLVESRLVGMGHQIYSSFPDSTDTDFAIRNGFDLLIVDEQKASSIGEQIRPGSGATVPILLLLPHDVAAAEWLDAGFDEILRLPLNESELTSYLSVHLQLRMFDRT
ncbi:MAG TPA: hypothetical protein VHV31_13845, partial [Nitrolancea sp.]|nr:hypothetical protein [Nitrolancea sp.]